MAERNARVVPLEVASFLESGVCLAVATRAADHAPDCAFAGGIRVAADGCHATLFLPVAAAATAIRNVRANGAVAVTASRPGDYRTFQLKGQAIGIVEVASDRDAQFVSAYAEAFAAQLDKVGIVPALARRLTFWPAAAVEVALSDVFDQTPGPRAGARLERP